MDRKRAYVFLGILVFVLLGAAGASIGRAGVAEISLIFAIVAGLVLICSFIWPPKD